VEVSTAADIRANEATQWPSSVNTSATAIDSTNQRTNHISSWIHHRGWLMSRVVVS
jgi:hypothetical protein